MGLDMGMHGCKHGCMEGAVSAPWVMERWNPESVAEPPLPALLLPPASLLEDFSAGRLECGGEGSLLGEAADDEEAIRDVRPVRKGRGTR